jgi:hypothetical protein
MVFESRVLRRIFGAEREEVVGGWRRLHYEELYNLYTSPSIVVVTKSRKMRLVGHVAWMGEMRNVYKIFVGKSEGNRPLKRARQRWESRVDVMKMGGNVCTGFICLRIGTTGGLL